MSLPHDTPFGWQGFHSSDGEFTIAIPPDWQQYTAVSAGAALCIRKSGALVEVFSYEGGKADQLSDFLAKSHAKISPFEAGLREGRVLQQKGKTVFGSLRYNRVDIQYDEHGAKMEVRYRIVGQKKIAVQVAMKTAIAWVHEHSDEFEEIVRTLRTRWLTESLPAW